MAAPKTLLDHSNAKLPIHSLDQGLVVIVDAQTEYREGRLPLDGIDAAAAEVAKLLAAARKAGTPIVHIKQMGRPDGLFDPATFGAFLPEAMPLVGETVIDKRKPNSFAGTDLETVYRASGRQGIILAGFMTHMCVSATARCALDLDIPVTLVAKATASRDLPAIGGGVVPAKVLHEAELAALADRFVSIAQTVDDLTQA
ncbi:isochorismatase family protein [Lacibacterium aquatile]|uniref:Isochorismatase family protein n=1 Tax=Lacibacterium aquatile TaxID=1168082 RepID=A0ABW5DWD2_9PROT